MQNVKKADTVGLQLVKLMKYAERVIRRQQRGEITADEYRASVADTIHQMARLESPKLSSELETAVIDRLYAQEE